MWTKAEESFYRSARGWAQYQARSLGLQGDIADDFEQSFVVKWLFSPVQPPPWTWPAGRSDRFLRRAARNHGLDLVRRLRYESALSADLRWDARRAQPEETGPETCILRRLFWQKIESGVRGLRPYQRNVFVRHYLQTATVEEMASASGLSRHAIHQNLFVARKQLRSILAAQGSTESELRSYVSLLGRGSAPEASLYLVRKEEAGC